MTRLTFARWCKPPLNSARGFVKSCASRSVTASAPKPPPRREIKLRRFSAFISSQKEIRCCSTTRGTSQPNRAGRRISRTLHVQYRSAAAEIRGETPHQRVLYYYRVL